MRYIVVDGYYFWVRFIRTSLFSRALEIMVYVREITPFHGRTIQASELLSFIQIYVLIDWFQQILFRKITGRLAMGQ